MVSVPLQEGIIFTSWQLPIEVVLRSTPIDCKRCVLETFVDQPRGLVVDLPTNGQDLHRELRVNSEAVAAVQKADLSWSIVLEQMRVDNLPYLTGELE